MPGISTCANLISYSVAEIIYVVTCLHVCCMGFHFTSKISATLSLARLSKDLLTFQTNEKQLV